MTNNAAVKLTGPRVRVIVYDREEPAEIHWFNLPKYGEPRFYTTTCSWNWFRNREGGRLVAWLDARRAKKKAVVPERRSYCNIIEPGDLMHAKEVELKVYDHLPTFEHSTLWEFYMAVGYDHKRKKYQPKENS